MNTTAAIYARISSDRLGEGLGVERQEKECRALAKRLGWDVVDVYVDNDLGAYRTKNRPAYLKLKAAVSDGEISAVLTWHPDRLTRQPRELEDLIDLLERHNTQVATVSAGTYDLTSAAGRMTARVIGATARYESEQKSMRQKSKARDLAERGLPAGGGPRPFGYEHDQITVRESEAVVVREALDLVGAGWSLRRTCRHLSERGVLSDRGKDFGAAGMRQILTSPRIVGLRSYQGEIIGDAVWPAIVDRDQWEHVRATLGDPRRKIGRTQTKHLLTGRVYAERDGAKLHGATRTARVTYAGHESSGCSINAPQLDALVIDAVLSRFDHVSLDVSDLDSSDSDSVIAALENELDELIAMRADESITLHEYVGLRKPVQARLDDARAQLKSTKRATTSTTQLLKRSGALRAAWGGLTFDQQQDVIFAVVDRIVIASAVRGRTKFDPDRVTIEWAAS